MHGVDVKSLNICIFIVVYFTYSLKFNKSIPHLGKRCCAGKKQPVSLSCGEESWNENGVGLLFLLIDFCFQQKLGMSS